MIRMVLLGVGFVVVTAALVVFQPGRLRAPDSAPEPVTRAEPAAVDLPIARSPSAGRAATPLGMPAGFVSPSAAGTSAVKAPADMDDEKMRRMTWGALSGLNQVTGRDSVPGQPGSLLHTIVQRSLTESPAGAADRTPPPATGTQRVYVVQPGDSLVSIAQRVYGDVNMTGLLFSANQAVLARPDDLRAGQKLILP